MMWIAMLFLLLGVEYRAIDKEHNDYTKDQSDARKEERDSFQRLLDKQEDSVRRILEQEDQHFKDTFAEAIRQDKHENARFYALLGRQEQLFRRQEELAQALNGRLLPANEPTPANSCHQGSDTSVVVMLGNESQYNAALVDRFPHVVFKSRSGAMLSLDRQGDSLVVNLDIKSADGKIIARLNQDGFSINRSNYFEMKKDKSSLVVFDEYGAQVLRVRYLNPRAISIDGIPVPGHPLSLPRGITYMCVSGGGVADIEVD
ncbi:MAG: hypothetical protein WA646_19400 [Candidatus Sulfotelmatobacter sp.]